MSAVKNTCAFFLYSTYEDESNNAWEIDVRNGLKGCHPIIFLKGSPWGCDVEKVVKLGKGKFCGSGGLMKWPLSGQELYLLYSGPYPVIEGIFLPLPCIPPMIIAFFSLDNYQKEQ